MKAFWDDNGEGVASNDAREVTVDEAVTIWREKISGTRGNFFGLIDAREETIQFYLDADATDEAVDAQLDAIVLMDFPQPAKRGSYCRHVRVDEVAGLIRRAFEVGADRSHFGELGFSAW